MIFTHDYYQISIRISIKPATAGLSNNGRQNENFRNKSGRAGRQVIYW